MALYEQEVKNEICWPAPLEGMYQLLGGGAASGVAPKLTHLGLADVLFITLVMSLPKSRRPWGIVTWMAWTFRLSRPSVYALAERVQERLTRPEVKEIGYLPGPKPGLEVTPGRVRRTALTAAFPGKMSLRNTQELLAEAFDESRSVGWLSELLSEAGEQAGEVLKKIDTSPLGRAICVRDETFFQDMPVLHIIDPLSMTLLCSVVAPDRQADTWALTLLDVESRGVKIVGLVEDMARMYPASLEVAESEAEVQKDVWHIESDGAQLQRDLERAALGSTKQVIELEKKLLRTWDNDLFEQKYIPAVAKESQLYDQHAAFSEWLGHLCDALEVVDWRSGEIRDRAINGWLLQETLGGLQAIDHPRIQTWVRSLRRHQHQLLTYLDWLAPTLAAYTEELAQILTTSQARADFMRLVARHWRLAQALTSGHSHLGFAAQQNQQALDDFLADNPALKPLLQPLHDLLDAACRASSLVENLNGLLKQFLHNRRSFRSSTTLQLYLNLFTLWHNMRVYQRGKRQGLSPYQMAGIQTPSHDWLALLGYPPA